MELPAPKKLSKRVTRWLSDEVVAAERRYGLDLPPPSGPTQSAYELADRYDVTPVTIWRWSRKANTKKDDRRRGRGRVAA